MSCNCNTEATNSDISLSLLLQRIFSESSVAGGRPDLNALSTGDITYHDLPDGGWITTADKSNKKTAVRIAKGVEIGRAHV